MTHFCANCWKPRGLDIHGRCEKCGSLAVDDLKFASTHGGEGADRGLTSTGLLPEVYGSALPQCFAAVDEVMRRYGL